MTAFNRLASRLGAMLNSVFRPVEGGQQITETPKCDLVVKAMLIGHSCCG